MPHYATVLKNALTQSDERTELKQPIKIIIYKHEKKLHIRSQYGMRSADLNRNLKKIHPNCLLGTLLSSNIVIQNNMDMRYF